MSTTLDPSTETTKPEDAADNSAESSPIPDYRVTKINSLFDNLIKQENGAIEDRIALGLELQHVKANLPHGKFKSWLKSNCPKISQRRANEFMQMAERLEAMPDLKEKLPGRSFAAFQKLVADEWTKRAKRQLNELVDCEREILDCHARIRVAVLHVVELTGDEIGYQDWKSKFGLTDEGVAGWTHQTEAMLISGFGHKRELQDDEEGSSGADGRTVPAALFADPDVRRAEEETVESAKAIGIVPVKVEEKHSDLTPEEQRAARGYAESDIVQQAADDAAAEEDADEPTASAA